VTTKDGFEKPVQYDIIISQDDAIAAPGGASTPGRKHIGGQVWSPIDAAFVITHFRENMVLRMEDGRQISFFHKDSAGNIGLHKWIG